MKVAKILLCVAAIYAQYSFSGPVRRGRSSESVAQSRLKSGDVKSSLEAMTDPKDKIATLTEWVEELGRRAKDSKNRLQKKKISKKDHTLFMNRLSEEIKKVSSEARRLGYEELANLWKDVGASYSRTVEYYR